MIPGGTLSLVLRIAVFLLALAGMIAISGFIRPA